MVVEVCDPDITNANFNNIEFWVVPDPIVVKTGEALSLHVAIDALKQVEDGGTVQIDVTKGGPVPLPVPCLEVKTRSSKYR